jgi:histidinol phosphatase-like PHP family hydrolase
MAPVKLPRDVNMEVAGALYDLALVHSSTHARVAYKRAARSVLSLERPVGEVRQAGGLREIRYIGPSSERVILEALEHGKSATAERAIAGSGRAAEVAKAHALRTNFLSRAAVLQVLRQPAKGLVRLEDYRGDLQMHSRWSDGGDTIEAMVRAAQSRGHAFAGITDHSYGLKIARGMSMEEVARQHLEIDRLNKTLEGSFRVIKSIEANVTADGSIDMKPAELALFEIVLAAAHSVLRKPHDQTERMLAAVRDPALHILGHPRGRMYSRQGVLARWDEVFEEAARTGVAIEIDGDFYRQDVDWALASRALAAGCLFALDSDAHSGSELVYSEYAIAHARLAGIPPDRIINAWPAKKLLEWAAAKRTRRPRRRGAG